MKTNNNPPQDLTSKDGAKRTYNSPILRSSEAFERLALASGCSEPEEELGEGDCTEQA